MGQISTEQTAILLDSFSDAVSNTQPEPTNYWWLLIIAILPVCLGVWLKRKK